MMVDCSPERLLAFAGIKMGWIKGMLPRSRRTPQPDTRNNPHFMSTWVSGIFPTLRHPNFQTLFDVDSYRYSFQPRHDRNKRVEERIRLALKRA